MPGEKLVGEREKKCGDGSSHVWTVRDRRAPELRLAPAAVDKQMTAARFATTGKLSGRAAVECKQPLACLAHTTLPCP